LRPPRGPGDVYAPLPLEIYMYAKYPDVEHQTLAAGGILLLILLLLGMNGLAILLRNRYRGRLRAA
jgi:phosphate transport system permease protein